MALFDGIVKKVLSEIKKVTTFNYRDIPEDDFVNGPVYVYHMTAEANLKGGLLKSGWESFYNLVNSYGPGIYCTVYPSFDKRADVRDENGRWNPTLDYDGGSSMYPARRIIYGQKDNKSGGGTKPAIMLVCKSVKPKPFWNFIILDEKIAMAVYRSHWRLNDQLKLIFGKDLYDYAYSKFGTKIEQWMRAGHVATYMRGNVAYDINSVLCSDVRLNRKINGLIFHGPGDGFVVIFRDYNALEPFGVSDDCGHTFREISVEETFNDYNNNNMDVRNALGLDRYFCVKTDTLNGRYLQQLKNIPFKYVSSVFFGDYALVGNTDNPIIDSNSSNGIHYSFVSTQNKADWKWNYIYKPLVNDYDDYMQMTVSPNIWFDVVSSRWDKNTAAVTKDGVLYTIVNNNGQFMLYDSNGKELGNLKTLTDDDLKEFKKSRPMLNVAQIRNDKVVAKQDDSQDVDNSQNTQINRPKKKFFGVRK